MRHFYFGLMDVLRGNKNKPNIVIDGRTIPEKPIILSRINKRNFSRVEFLMRTFVILGYFMNDY